MAKFNIREEDYDAFWEELTNFLKDNSGFNVKGVARSIPRNPPNKMFEAKLKGMFWIEGDPSKKDVYPKLVKGIKETLGMRVEINELSEYISLWRNIIEADIELVTEKYFKSKNDGIQYSEIY